MEINEEKILDVFLLVYVAKASGAAIQKNKNLKSDKRKKGQTDSHPDILDEQNFEDEIIISYID